MNSKLIAIIVAGVVGLPMAAAASTIEDQNVVTGHTVYADMSGFDPNIALIAGLVESKVVWFNGVTVFNSLGDGYVYATEAGQCSPLKGQDFVFQDYDLSFRDPNNFAHIVAHYTYKCAGLGNFGTDTVADTLLGLNETKHVWITLTHQKQVDAPVAPNAGSSGGRLYNFATGVDTSFFGERGTTEHDGMGGATPDSVNNGDSYCPTEEDHVCNGGEKKGEDTLHDHNTGSVDLYFSKEDVEAVNATGAAHPGTEDGCALDTYCAFVTDFGQYPDPEDVWNNQTSF